MKQYSNLLCAVIASASIGAGCASKNAQTVTEATQPPPPAEVSVSPAKAAEAPKLEPVYFAYDTWTLDERARKTLKDNASHIEKHPEWGALNVEGHCDERGSDEYNVALGQRRADVVKRYLIDLGVDAKRLSTVSFGEYRPAVSGHDEGAWQLNRRGQLTPDRQQVTRREGSDPTLR